MLSFGFIIRTRCPFLMPTDIVHTSNVLHNIYLPAWLQRPAATALNSTLTMLMVEYAGRANLSGILKVELYELARMMVPNPLYIEPVSDAVLTAADHSLVTRDRRTESGFRLTLTDTRRAIDGAVFDWLGLTVGERDGVYNAAYGGVVGRQLAEGRVSG